MSKKGAGGLLLLLNAAGMVFAAISNTFAVATDKNTSAEDKKLLVPAGIFTGVANIGTYYAITDRLIKNLKNIAENRVSSLSADALAAKAKEFGIKEISKLQKGGFLGLKKTNPDQIKDAANVLFGIEKTSDVAKNLLDKAKNITETLKDCAATEYAKNTYKNNFKEGAGVIGAFAGAIIGSAILTPIIRDVSAYFVQKIREKKQPELKDKPYKPYFDPTHIGNNRYQNAPKQPLSMKTYMTFTNANMKI